MRRRTEKLGEEIPLFIGAAGSHRHLRQHIESEPSTNYVWKKRIVAKRSREDSAVKPHQKDVLEGPRTCLCHVEDLDSPSSSTDRFIADTGQPVGQQSQPFVPLEDRECRELLQRGS